MYTILMFGAAQAVLIRGAGPYFIGDLVEGFNVSTMKVYAGHGINKHL